MIRKRKVGYRVIEFPGELVGDLHEADCKCG